MDRRARVDPASTDALTRGLELAAGLLASWTEVDATSPWPSHALERLLADVTQSDVVRLLAPSVDPGGMTGRAIETGMIRTGPADEVQTFPAGGHSWAAAVPYECGTSLRVALLIRDDGPPFGELELARAVGTLQFARAVQQHTSWAPRPADPATRTAVERTHWPRALRLGNGRSVFLRPARADDEAALLRMHSRCSPDVLRRRFIVTEPRLRSRQIHRLLRNDHDHAAIVVGDGTEVIALANVRIPSGVGPAELAVLMQDTLQHEDIGYALAAAAADVAASAGRQALRVDALIGHSAAMEDVLARLGTPAVETPRDGFVTLTVEFATARGGGTAER